MWALDITVYEFNPDLETEDFPRTKFEKHIRDEGMLFDTQKEAHEMHKKLRSILREKK